MLVGLVDPVEGTPELGLEGFSDGENDGLFESKKFLSASSVGTGEGISDGGKKG